MAGAPSAAGAGKSASYPLSGNVTKALLVVAPAFARETAYLQYIKYRLYETGFIVVREEYRLLNIELASNLCSELDTSLPPPPTRREAKFGASPSSAPTAIGAAAAVDASAPPQSLVGTAYLFVVARGDCHAHLQSFVSAQMRGSEATVLETLFTEHAALRGDAAPLWVAPTAVAATAGVRLLFPRMLSESVPTGPVSHEYVQAHLKQALVPALTELAQQKPAEPLQWLAMHLLMNNTEAPPMLINK